MIKLLKWLLRALLRLLYRVEVKGLAHYHQAGPRALIVANHTSLLDGVLLYAWLPDAPTFAINTNIAGQRRFRPYLCFVDLFLMDPANPLSVKSMIKFLQQDKKAVIFPEGRITVTGVLMKIYEGPGLIADKADAAILPVSIEGAQYSHAAYLHQSGYTQRFPRITLRFLAPEKITLPADVQGHERRRQAAKRMQEIMYQLAFAATDYHRTVFSALLDAVKKYGRHTVIMEDINQQPLTYGQLLTRTFILSDVFKHQSKAAENVGLLLPNVSATVISYLALHCLGRVPTMLNYTAGIQALTNACEMASVKTIYSSKKFIANAGLEDVIDHLSASRTIIYLEDIARQVSRLDKLKGMLRSRYPLAYYRRVCTDQDTGKPATILFTSGSEGIPKGVVLSHVNLVSNYAQVRCHIDFRPADMLFSCLPLFHCFGLNAGCLMPLLGGSRIYLYPNPLHYRLIPEHIYNLGATILFGTNIFFRGYAKYAHAFDFHSLRHVVAGAEKLQQDTQQLWMDKFGIRILQGYGVTECSPVVAVNTPINCKHGSVGRLLPGMQARLKPIAGISEGGELMVSGPNVMLGYLLHDRAGELIPPPQSGGSAWHSTGDIVSIDAAGYITILGRAKRFAKIAGEMISLTAVEELAGQTWPKHIHAAVSLPDERRGEKIILITNHQAALRKQLQQQIKTANYSPLYLPEKIAYAEELPVLSTGKIDYLTLTAMARQAQGDPAGLIGRLASLMRKQDLPEANVTDPNTHQECQLNAGDAADEGKPGSDR